MLCPWCRVVDQPIHLLKRHVKYCDKSPHPRGLTAEKRAKQKTEIEKLLELGNKDAADIR